ncbi:2-keto-3-deoxygluconate permease [Paenibacillus sp. QZ-Y1]|uniref:2-keto-3-deoxygluconate permease n=1 Tax=Paenibacillus sp. QZ-Y1 TaxID=3414511 RepID=UPI003F7AFC1E
MNILGRIKKIPGGSGFNPAYTPYVDTAIAQIAFAVILTSMTVPYIVKRLAGRTATEASLLEDK